MSEDNAAPGQEGWLVGRVRYPVYYEDTDFSGYVYHANYLKYFERGREELIGIEYLRDLYKRGLHYVVARMEIAFHYPARHGDLVEVETRMRLSASPVGLVEQVVWLPAKDTKKAPTKLVSAKIKLVAVDDSGHATKLPADVADYFRTLAAQQTGATS